MSRFSTALTYASGLGATTTIMLMLKSGDHVVTSDDVYGGIHYGSLNSL